MPLLKIGEMMPDTKSRNYNKLVLSVVLALAVIVIGSWGFITWREEQNAPQMTPELVVEAFRKANYETNNLRDRELIEITDQYFAGGTPTKVVEFYTKARNDKDATRVRVVVYASGQQAEGSTNAINRLNERMAGGFSYAFCRGRILMSIDTRSESVAREFNEVFQSAAASKS
jgi:fructose-bisphosphate aldolase class 1